MSSLAESNPPPWYNIFGRKKLERIRPGWKVLASTGRGPVARQLPPWWKVCELFSGVGVYISRVEEGSVAERAGLRPGDTILEVNGTPFRAVTHEEALKVSFYFHFPNQKHFLSRITQSALQFQFYREYEVLFFSSSLLENIHLCEEICFCFNFIHFRLFVLFVFKLRNYFWSQFGHFIIEKIFW